MSSHTEVGVGLVVASTDLRPLQSFAARGTCRTNSFEFTLARRPFEAVIRGAVLPIVLAAFA